MLMSFNCENFKNLGDIKFLFPAGDGQAEKMPKTEISEDSLRSYVQNGTLGKLTVSALKDTCRHYGLKSGGKKQELIDALTEYFSRR